MEIKAAVAEEGRKTHVEVEEEARLARVERRAARDAAVNEARASRNIVLAEADTVIRTMRGLGMISSDARPDRGVIAFAVAALRGQLVGDQSEQALHFGIAERKIRQARVILFDAEQRSEQEEETKEIKAAVAEEGRKMRAEVAEEGRQTLAETRAARDAIVNEVRASRRMLQDTIYDLVFALNHSADELAKWKDELDQLTNTTEMPCAEQIAELQATIQQKEAEMSSLDEAITQARSALNTEYESFHKGPAAVKTSSTRVPFGDAANKFGQPTASSKAKAAANGKGKA